MNDNELINQSEVEEKEPVVEEKKERNVPPPPDPTVRRWTHEEVEDYIRKNGVYPNLGYNEDPGEPDKKPTGYKAIPQRPRSSEKATAVKMKHIARIQKKFGMSVGDAAKTLGYSGNNVGKITNHPAYLMEKTRLMKALDNRDRNLMDKVAKVMIKGLKAKKKVNVKDGLFEKTEDVPDMAERRKAAELIARAAKQMGMDDDIGAEHQPVNFNVLINMVKEAEKERGL